MTSLIYSNSGKNVANSRFQGNVNLKAGGTHRKLRCHGTAAHLKVFEVDFARLKKQKAEPVRLLSKVGRWTGHCSDKFRGLDVKEGSSVLSDGCE